MENEELNNEQAVLIEPFVFEEWLPSTDEIAMEDCE